MQDFNFKVMIFDDKRLISIIYAPDYLYSQNFWNIALINPETNKIIPINGFSRVDYTRKTHLKFYLIFLKYLKDEVDESKAKQKLGFNSASSTHKLNDLVILKDSDFISAIKKLPIQWISEKIKSEEKLKLRSQELNDFFETVGNAFKNIFGEISFKTMMSLLGPHFKTD